MRDEVLEQRVVALVSDANYRPVKPRTIARQLGVDPHDMPDFRQTIKRLIRAGKLRFGPKHLVQPGGQTNRDERLGRFFRAAGGFGFVRPRGNRAQASREEDIYIPASKARDAAQGDLVLVRVSQKRHGPEMRTAGEIVEIVARRSHQFVGTYFEQLGAGFVRIDGTSFPDPIAVGDPGAKGVRQNDRVVIEMVQFPSPHREGQGVITEVLGDRNRPGVDTRTIFREFDLPESFPPAAMEEARQVADRYREEIAPDRRDLTGATVITIDPEDARDFDDAISLSRTEQGNWLLGVHIADVSHFVREGHDLDAEARQRATSVYLPGVVIPMLPEQISNHLASLQPDRLRLARTAFLEFQPEGRRVRVEICRSAIRSCRRFNYEEVDDYLVSPEPWREKLTPEVWELLHNMNQLAMTLRRRRLKRGALELNMPEVKLELDDPGNVKSARREIQTVSHQIIEEFMLAANFAVAERLRDAGLAFLRRVHDEPHPKKLHVLEKFVHSLSLHRGSLQDRFKLKELLAEVSGSPLEQAVNLAVLKSLPKAVYSPSPVGHYALASDCYCHFTSPIRRYPDLTVHRLLDQLDQPDSSNSSLGDLVGLGDHCSDREQRAEQAERELVKLKLLRYFEGQLGKSFPAIVMGVESYGVFVQCTGIPGEGLVARDHLTDDDYEYDRGHLKLQGRRSGNTFRLGDTIEVQVARVDLVRREIDFTYVRHLRSPHRADKADGKRLSGKTRRREKPRGQGLDANGKPKKSQGKRKKSHGKRKKH